MNPMRLITYALLTSVVSLVAMGGVGFYVGYSAGRGNMDELKALITAGGSPENAAAIAEVLKQQVAANQPVAAPAPPPPPAPEVNLAPVLDEIRSMSAQIGKLEKNATPPPPQVVDRVVERVKEDPKAKQELASVKLLLSEANDQYQGCKQSLTTLEAKFDEVKNAPTQQVAMVQPDVRPDAQPGRDPASVVLFDNVLLKREQKKVYSDVDVAISLNSIASRSARVVVNQQALGISFGERKIFQHRDVTCELVLMETDLEGGKARFSIACKR
jgi:hypothetical protein